jgi:hypothetical protein
LEEPTEVETDDNATIEKRKRKWESDVSPKYTDGGIIYTDKRKMTHRGWNEEGICRFNVLCLLVQRDRTANPVSRGAGRFGAYLERRNAPIKQKG